MCLAQGPKRSDVGEARTRGPSVSNQALYHCATALPHICTKLSCISSKIVNIYWSISSNICFGAKKNRLIETVLLSTHNICFGSKIRKMLVGMPCGHLLGKGWPLGSRLWCLIVTLSLSHWYPGWGVVLECTDSWYLPSFLLRSLSTVLSPPEDSRIQELFKTFEWFSVLLKADLIFKDFSSKPS